MGGYCKGICTKFGLMNSSVNNNYKNKPRQKLQFVKAKKCRRCIILFPIGLAGFLCPCCHGKLATKTHTPNKKNRVMKSETAIRY